jgi:hypothetical protein
VLVSVQVKWYGAMAKGKAKQGAVNGLAAASEYLLEASRRLVPHEEGTLERSGVASVDAGQLRAAVSYDTPYAVRQHEEMDYQHDLGRTAKYLENPLNSERSVLLRIMAGEIGITLGAGLVEYTSKAGRKSMITAAQAANYTRNKTKP